MPVVNGEVCYEALLGRIPAEVPRLMFWACVLSGAAGHTYGANGIWQVNRKDQPYGKSPHGGDYGHLPWDEAMKLPGSGQLGMAKRLLEKVPWQQFEPHPEWAVWEGGSDAPAWGDWIWYPEGDPAKDAPVAARFFRRTFELPEGKTVVRAVLHLTVDDKFTAYLNGELVGSHADWMTGKEFTDVARLLAAGQERPGGARRERSRPEGRQPGRPVVRPGNRAVRGRENGRPFRRRLALFARGVGRLAEDGFRRPGLGEGAHRGEVRRRPVGADVGRGRAGRVPDALRGRRAGGSPHHLPAARPGRHGAEAGAGRAVCRQHLRPDDWARREEIGAARPDADGSWTASPPSGTAGDWVLVLEAKP